MAIYDDSRGLENFLLKAQSMSQHLAAVSVEEESSLATLFSENSPAPEPMQTDRYHLSHDERQCHIGQRLCLYCGDDGHLLQTCPIRPPRTAASTALINSVMTTHPYHDAVLIHASRSFTVKVLFDSRSSGNFISSRLLSTCTIPRQRNATCYLITTIQGNH